MTDPKKPAAPVVDETARHAVAKALYEAMEGPVNNQDFGRQQRQWESAQALAGVALEAIAALAQQPRTEPAGEAVEWSDQFKRMPRDERIFENRAGSVDDPRPEQVEDEAVERAFEIGYCWRGMLTGQVMEDSRAVSRTLGADLFAGIDIDGSAVPGFETADIGIYYAKRAIKAALVAALARPAPKPAADVPAGKIEQWQWADCGHAAWFDGQPPFGTKEQEVTRRTVYLAPTPANAATEKEQPASELDSYEMPSGYGEVSHIAVPVAVLKSSALALRSYEFGNAAPALARACAQQIEQIVGPGLFPDRPGDEAVPREPAEILVALIGDLANLDRSNPPIFMQSVRSALSSALALFQIWKQENDR